MAMSYSAWWLQPFVLLTFLICYGVHSFRFDLSGPHAKCFSEDIHTNAVVLADYRVVSPDSKNISVEVTSPYGKRLHITESILSGQFSFTSKESGTHSACFWLPSSPSTEGVIMELDWKTGIAAKDWETIARKEKVEGIELELMKLQDNVAAIHENLLLLKQREREMREINELTNTRVAWFSITSLMVCLLVAIWQLWHLKNYFQKKKLI